MIRTSFIKSFFIALLLFCSTNQGFAQKKTSPYPEKPKLIISIFVEGMRYDYLYQFWEHFTEGGFKALINNGLIFQNAEYTHYYTESAPGYASFATGADPSRHGITGSFWRNRIFKRKEFCVEDPKARPLGTSSLLEKYSPKHLLAPTFSDALKISNFKKSKVIGISPKNYAAILPVGHLANAAYWIDKKNAQWISSDYYLPVLPEWVKRFNNKNFPNIYLNKTWVTSLPINSYHTSLNDNNSFETGFAGNKITFPYNLKELRRKGNNIFHLLNYTPFGNTYTKDFAISAIVAENLGKDNYCDYLHIGFTANQKVAEKFSIRSVELADTYIRLDKDLEHLLKFVDEFVGRENTLIILTSDRGSGDSPKMLESLKMPGGYFKDKKVPLLLESYLRAMYHIKDLPVYFDGAYLYLDRQKIEKAKLSLAEVQARAANFLIDFKGVNNVLTSSNLESRSYNSDLLKKVQNNYHKQRSGDLSVLLLPGYRPGSNPAYGSGYKNYSHVPLVLYGWKTKPGKTFRKTAVKDIASGISYLLQIAFPSASDGQIPEAWVQNLHD